MEFALALPRETPSIPVVRRVVGDALRGLGVAEDCVADILVAASEACTNAVQHARATGDYRVAGRVDDGNCLLEIEDGGHGPRPVPRDPPQEPVPEPGVLSESGRGIKIMRALVDDLDIDRTPDRGTIVHLRKRLTWRDGALVGRLDRRLMHSAG
ncbi:ATP-binding protein [Actinomadura verrucosospora]|uniref:Putative anti-sigma regulatory factor n=1 Tax=Actinomadura verrucosospora TaxID=46165 RepID=A0A7D3VUC7_ACTVE|nr:ATP-binding protein [Actinomadura verrucosospora]QKG23139.1 putative anti-sigma regulatory factor [Actinomadura verrucosospora]